MSNNIPDSKKLEVKSELLRHLETAKSQMNAGAPSSAIKVFTLAIDIGRAQVGELVIPEVWDGLLNR